MADSGTIDRIESAANISLRIATGADSQLNNVSGSGEGDSGGANFIEVPISRLDTSKEVEVTEIREGTLKPNGYAVNSISYSGSVTFKGSDITRSLPGDADGLNDLVYDEHGVPVPTTIVIEHEMNDEPENIEHVLFTSESYEVRSESETETAYDFVAMNREQDQSSSSEIY